ncbi:GNAT family N-acetyltransferase [Deinococcus sp. AJ005]|uniref:GNAT family N-acetyltransferase n=1 Tax=Deinococcus sp. AJ005 TaxID=2652443 RepID=UPI00125CD296|nr:GNAT family N-acetyltransferase [Deinococcus sp. AJ005]QFP76202.1 GNAT family N-acetyltransferase [Deinococcus sp. AJ005]
MTAVPPLTPALIERLEAAIRQKGWDALRRASDLAGNPYGITLFGRDGLWASMVRALPELPWYNTVSRLTEDRLTELNEVLSVYQSERIAPRLSVWATHLTPTLGAALFDRGFIPIGVGVTLYAAAEAPPARTFAGIQIRELSPDEDTAAFNAMLLAGYGFTDPAQQALAVLENEELDVRRYLALVDGQPAAVASLCVRDDVAYLTGAATLPQFRGRGAQAALIHRRLSAIAADCELATVTTAFASGSQRNLERHGFRVAQLKTFWSERKSLP